MREKLRKIKESAVRVTAGVGMASILLVGGYTGYLGYTAIKDSDFNLLAAISGLFTSPVAEEITFATSYELVNHDEPFTLTWEHVGKTSEGSYTFFHECEEGISFSLVQDEESRTSLACGDYTFVSVDETVARLVASSTDEQFADVPISIMFIKDDSAEEVRGGTIVTIINNNLILSGSGDDVPIFTPVTSDVIRGAETGQLFQFGGDSSPTAPAAIDPNGRPDLSVKYLAMGYIEVGTNEFFAVSTIPRGKRAAVRFEIANIGNNLSGSWSFNAALPTSPHHIFHSQAQTSLRPGERIEFTLGFDRITSNESGTVIVNADPASSIAESNEENNILEIELSIAPF